MNDTDNNHPIYSAEEIAEMRNWVKDCEWGEQFEDEEIDDLPVAVLIRGIRRHYDGGMVGFLVAIKPV
jgi:hypothetical protein